MNFPAAAVSRKARDPLPFAEIHADHHPADRNPNASGYQPFATFCSEPRRLADWHRLEKQASLPMQSEAFVRAVVEYLVPEGAVRTYYVDDGNSLVALLPLVREKGLFGRLRIVGESELCEPADWLCTGNEAASCLAAAIISERRVIDLDRVPVHSPLIRALEAAVSGRGKISVRPARPTPTISLDLSWKNPESKFNSGRRSDFRRAARRAAEFGSLSFEVIAPAPDEFDALFDEAVDVEGRSWKTKSGTAIAADSCKERFFRHYFRAACSRGEFRLAFFRIGGRAVAMQMALECLDRYWLFKIGFDETFSRCSPGTLLMLHTIGRAAERQLQAYEFLGHVEPWIAQLWTRQQHECARVRVYPYNLRGAVGFGADSLVWLHKKLARAAS